MTCTLIDMTTRERRELPDTAAPAANPIATILSTMATANAAILHAQASWWENEYRDALRRVWGEQAVRTDDTRPCDSEGPSA